MPHVWPVPGLYLNSVPAVEHDCDDPFCVESGAFTTQPPPPEGVDGQTEDPAEAGSSDTEEL